MMSSQAEAEGAKTVLDTSAAQNVGSPLHCRIFEQSLSSLHPCLADVAPCRSPFTRLVVSSSSAASTSRIIASVPCLGCIHSRRVSNCGPSRRLSRFPRFLASCTVRRVPRHRLLYVRSAEASIRAVDAMRGIRHDNRGDSDVHCSLPLRAGKMCRQQAYFVRSECLEAKGWQEGSDTKMMRIDARDGGICARGERNGSC